MLNKTYLLTGARDPGLRLWAPTTRVTSHGEAFWRSRERGKKASPCRTQKNKPNRQFKRRYQPC